MVDFAQAISLSLFINQYKILKLRDIYEGLSLLFKFNRIQCFANDINTNISYRTYYEDYSQIALYIKNVTFLINTDILLFLNVAALLAIIVLSIFVCKNCERLVQVFFQSMLFINYVTITEMAICCCIGLKFGYNSFYNTTFIVFYLIYELGLNVVSCLREKSAEKLINELFDDLVISSDQKKRSLATNNLMVLYTAKKIASVVIVFLFYGVPEV